MKRLIIVEGLPVIKQLKKFNGNPDYFETALMFLEKRKDIKRFFEEISLVISKSMGKKDTKMIKQRIRADRKKLIKKDEEYEEYLKWKSFYDAETILIGCDVYVLDGRFFKKFKKVLGKKFDKARILVGRYEKKYNL